MATETKKTGNGGNGGQGSGAKGSSKVLDALPGATGPSAAEGTATVMTDAEKAIMARREQDQKDEQEGFIRVNPLDGLRIFYTVSLGVELRGIVLGRFEKDGAYRTNADGELNYWYQIQLTAPYADCVIGKGEEKEVYAAQPGDVIIVDERSAMKCIAPVLEKLQSQGKKLEVLLRAVAKNTTSRGRRVWNFDIKGRILDLKAPAAQLPMGAGFVPGDKQLPMRAEATA